MIVTSFVDVVLNSYLKMKNSCPESMKSMFKRKHPWCMKQPNYIAVWSKHQTLIWNCSLFDICCKIPISFTSLLPYFLFLDKLFLLSCKRSQSTGVVFIVYLNYFYFHDWNFVAEMALIHMFLDQHGFHCTVHWDWSYWRWNGSSQFWYCVACILLYCLILKVQRVILKV